MAEELKVKEVGPKLKLIRTGAAAHIINKLVRSPADEQQYHSRNTPPDTAALDVISDTAARKITNTTSLKELLPDVELAEEIMVSSILSPKDMLDSKLMYSLSTNSQYTEAASAFIETVEDFFDNELKLSDNQGDILHEILFQSGSYVLGIIPESQIDAVINENSTTSVESINEKTRIGTANHLGILGDGINRQTIKGRLGSLESITDYRKPPSGMLNRYTEVSDDFTALKLPVQLDLIRNRKVRDILKQANIGMEARKGYGAKKKVSKDKNDRLGEQLFKKRKFTGNELVRLSYDQYAKNQSHPLVVRFPSEATIPVFVKGDTGNHVGYFILIDESGGVVSKTKDADYYNQIQKNFEEKQNDASNFINQTHEAVYGKKVNYHQLTIQQIEEYYAKAIEEDLLTRLKNGAYGEGLDIGRNNELYRIMLGRALAKMGSRLLFIPAELVTYYAFNYNDFGIGKSRLNNSEIIGSIRAMLMFSNTMASVRNSIGRTRLNITLDEKDPTPEDTISMIQHEYSKSRQANYPLGSSNPNEIIEYLRSSAVDISVEGNPRYPSTRIEVEDVGSDVGMPDTDLEERLYKNHIRSIGMAPETIDATIGTDFAANVISSDLLLTKRVMKMQGIQNGHNEDYIRKYILNSGPLLEQLKEVLKENKVKESEIEEVLTEFIEAIQVSLPTPSVSKIERQQQAHDIYSEFLDTALSAYFAPEMLDGMLDSDLENVIEPLLMTIKSYYMRNWLRNNNVLPELSMISDKEESAIFITETEEYIKSLMDNMGDLMRRLRKKDRKFTRKMDKDEEKFDAEVEAEEEAENPPEEETETPSEEPEGEGGTEEGGTEEGGEESEEETPEGETEEEEKPEEGESKEKPAKGEEESGSTDFNF